LCGVVGKDESADNLRAALGNIGVGAENLTISETRPTTTKTRVVVQHQQIARVDDETKKL
jgi:bifunctional ADP-heptose synthase (sugar kinase/adenylyltransferase)